MNKFTKDEEVYFYNKETNEILQGKIFDVRPNNEYQMICYISIRFMMRTMPYTPVVSESEISYDKNELEHFKK
jgi:hypothetical protein